MKTLLIRMLLVSLFVTQALAQTIELPADAPAERTVELVEQWRPGEDDEGKKRKGEADEILRLQMKLFEQSSGNPQRPVPLL